jgi:hypothetical protein
MTTSTKPVSAKATANKTPKTPVKTTTKTPKTPVKTTTKTPKTPVKTTAKTPKTPVKKLNKKNVLQNIAWIALILLIVLLIVLGVRYLSRPQQQLQQQPAEPKTSEPLAINHITWSAYGTPSFIVTNGEVKESASDVFTDPTKGSLTLEFKPTEPTCLLQFGVTEVYTSPFSATFVEGDSGAGFRVIAKSHWSKLPVSDGAYNLCWNR